MTADRDRDRDDRPSWREIDRRRDRARRSDTDERRPRGRAAQARSRQATRQYLKAIDQKLFGGTSGGEAAKLAAAVREALGTPELARACRSYLERVGRPTEAALISAFLDARQREIVLEGLEAAREAAAAGTLDPSPGLRAQLRMLADGLDDEIAERAEAVLERL